MPEDEQVERNRVMQHRLARYSIGGWVGDFMDRLEGVKRLQLERGISKLTPEILGRILHDYKTAKRRLILLDYDGTLVPFKKWPRKAQPDGDVSKMLARLARSRKNDVVMVSGRDKETLDEWLAPLGVGLVAEHGVWLKEPRGEWSAVEILKDDWKVQVRPLLELYVDRTPGSFIEEKSFSLAWHYRKADPAWGATRARELRDDLENLVANLNIGVLEGSKVIEIKDLSINKGRASAKWIAGDDYDFILAIGDDWTDEDMFEEVPESAYSIRVGLTATRARYNVDSYQDVRYLLSRLKG
jgi:trehalose 6-phosphate synthase/phosphatase